MADPYDLDNFDYSAFDFPNQLWYIIPEWQIAVKISTFIPLLIFGILGNFMLLNVIIRNRALQTPTHLLLANMALADFFVLTICPVLYMYKDFYQNFLLGTIGCKMEGYLQAIVLPTETRLTMFGTKMVMACTWIAGFTIAVPLAVYRTYKERAWKNFLETFCMENTTILPSYWLVLFATLVWFPLCVMIICYTAIFWKQ
ncbi:Cholecystokinin receptor type A, partial [Pseudolycoriella hygida]